MPLQGLHEEDIKHSVIWLRQSREKPNRPASKDKSLKITDLQNSLAIALGARSYEHWRVSERQRIINFLAENGMTRPKDLIRWKDHPGFADPLSAQRVADRLFNSGLPIPKRLFTGVGSLLFAAKGYGRLDICDLAGKGFIQNEQYIDYCELHADEVVLRANLQGGIESTDFVDLTGRALLLNAMSPEVGCMFNLLGDNLLESRENLRPVFALYNANDRDLALYSRLFGIFRAEIERTTEGWVEVLPLPENDNIIFLRGTHGAFDWVVRDQRDEPYTGNPLSPIFKTEELPSEMRNSKLIAHLYFKRDDWQDRLKHQAEQRHYAEGGTVKNWPGYNKLLLRELIAGQRFAPPRPGNGLEDMRFIPHRLQNRVLMISPLITIEDYWRFFENSEWRQIRTERSARAHMPIEEDLDAVNLGDRPHLPASVTWFDAIAYCRHFEVTTELPVRLLDVEEWRQICPRQVRDIRKDDGGDVTRAIVGGDGDFAHKSAHRYDGGGTLRYHPKLAWTSNDKGLEFLSAVDFGEWLDDYQWGQAPAANAATGEALLMGPLERVKCPANLTMRYKGMKVGFRICYVAQPDA